MRQRFHRRTTTRVVRIPPKLARQIAQRAGVEAPAPKGKARKQVEPSPLEERLIDQIAAAGLPAPEREVRLVPGRKFRCDLVWRDACLVVEVEGGVFTRGRHTRGSGFVRDAEKYNALALAGFTVLRVAPPQIRSGQALKWIEQGLKKGQAA